MTKIKTQFKSKSKQEHRIKIQLFMLCLVIASMLVALGIGNVYISPIESLHILLEHLPILGSYLSFEDVKATHITIVMTLRLPRILLSICGGFGLSYAGVIYQGVFKNPMADPYLLGVSSGAALGATLGILFPLGQAILGFSYISLMAFAGALAVLAFIFKLSQKTGMQIRALLLAGLSMNYLLSAIISALMLFHENELTQVYFWTMGSFRQANYSQVLIVAIVVLVTYLGTYWENKRLDILLFGDDTAISMGVDASATKRRLLIFSSLMCAVIVAACGVIGFVGLIVPHVCRIFMGSRHQKLMSVAPFLGSLFMVMSDTLARSIIPNMEISVGIVTSIVGVPIFLWMLIREKSLTG